MIKKSGAERREHVRARRVLSIQFRIKKTKRKNADQDWHLSTTQNMSVGGIGFYTDVDVRKDDVLEISVTMSGVLEIFSGEAKVMRVEKKKTGVQQYVGLKVVTNPSRKRAAKTVQSKTTKKKKRGRSLKKI